MDFYIHKDFIGFDKHILVKNGEMLVTSKLSQDYFIFGVPELDFPCRSLDELFKLNGLSLPVFPPEKYKKIMRSLISKPEIKLPWQQLIPKKQYISMIKNLVIEVDKLYKEADPQYYKTTYQATNQVLSSFGQCKLDNVLLQKLLFIEENKSIKAALESFKEKNGLLEPTYYNRDTKTGRLRVVSGPSVLRLKKEHRSILKSQFGPDGSLFYLDYKSLEPRVALATNNFSREIPPDIYSFVLDSLNIHTIKRDSVKQVVLSQLFGASDDTIIESLNGLENAQDFIKLISEFFGLASMRANLMEQLKLHNGRGFRNYYGRWVDCSDAHPYMLINYFIQSTAVDVAMLGFNSVIEFIRNSNLQKIIVPVFVLHDALILDVKNSAKNQLVNLVEAGASITKFDKIRFYLECTQLI